MGILAAELKGGIQLKRNLYTNLGMGMAAAATLAMLAWPTKNRKRRKAMKALGKAADELGGMMKFF